MPAGELPRKQVEIDAVLAGAWMRTLGDVAEQEHGGDPQHECHEEQGGKELAARKCLEAIQSVAHGEESPACC